MNQYHKENPVPDTASSPIPETSPESLFNRAAARSSLTTFPVSPFLVPSIIEALLDDSSTYKDLVEVVPSEADLYCARHLRQHGGLVLTGDSDLLVYDLGIDGSVCFFKDLEESQDGRPGTLHGLVYSPTRITERLDVPATHGLRALAFEMIMDPHGTFRQLRADASNLRAVDKFQQGYSSFLREYNSLPPEVGSHSNSSSKLHPEFMKALHRLDPRISEYVLQFPSLAGWANNIEPDSMQTASCLQIFLPFLVDCPTRTTAWEPSMSLRQLAYGLFKSIVPKNEQDYCITEHRRRNNMNGKGYQVASCPDVNEACHALTSLIDQVRHTFSSLSVLDQWMAFAVCQEVTWSASIGKPSLSGFVAQSTSASTRKPKNHVDYTWDGVHLMAQVHGVFYSLRMLQQLSHLLLSYQPTTMGLEEVYLLYDKLTLLPPLPAIPCLSNIISFAKMIESENMVQSAHDILGLEDYGSTKLEETAESSKKKRSANPVLSSSKAKKTTSNFYELLDME